MEARQSRDTFDHVMLTVNVPWNIWKARNATQFNQRTKEPYKVSGEAVHEWREYDEVSKMQIVGERRNGDKRTESSQME